MFVYKLWLFEGKNKIHEWLVVLIHNYFPLIFFFFFLFMQKLKTRVIKKDVNPEWNEDLTLSVTDPNLPVKLVSISLTLIIFVGSNSTKIVIGVVFSMMKDILVYIYFSLFNTNFLCGVNSGIDKNEIDLSF